MYADRPMDPHSKRAAKAEDAAVNTLTDAYRILMEMIKAHNNRPATLKRMKELVKNNLPPVPQEAYLWGLKIFHQVYVKLPSLMKITKNYY